MQLTIVKSPANPMRLWIVDQENPTEMLEGTDCIYEYQITRPVTLIGLDPDHLLISALKMFAGKLTGFSSWQEFAATLASIEDVDAAATAYGTTLQTLLYNGKPR